MLEYLLAKKQIARKSARKLRIREYQDNYRPEIVASKGDCQKSQSEK